MKINRLKITTINRIFSGFCNSNLKTTWYQIEKRAKLKSRTTITLYRPIQCNYNMIKTLPFYQPTHKIYYYYCEMQTLRASLEQLDIGFAFKKRKRKSRQHSHWKLCANGIVLLAFGVCAGSDTNEGKNHSTFVYF